MTDGGETPIADASALLWEESKRQIVRQEADLDGLRNQATAILSVSSVVVAIFGSASALLHRHTQVNPVAAGVGLGGFALSVVCVIVVMAPWWGWEFSQKLASWFPDLRGGKVYPVDVTGNLSEHFELSRVANQKRLNCMYVWFWLACVFTAIEVVAWGIAIAL